MRYGERQLRERYPQYAEQVLAFLTEPQRTTLLLRVSYARTDSRPWRVPRPSELFPTISAGLDDRLVRTGDDTDFTLCQLLATVPSSDQAEFYERYKQDPQQARRWAALPRWQRPIMAGTPEDRLIWKLFITVRLRLYGHANGHPATIAGLARCLVQEIGFWEGIKDHQRICEVLSTYGSMLAHGQDVGDVVNPPWTTV